MNDQRASATARLIAAATVMREESRATGGMPPAGSAAWCSRMLSMNRSDRLLLASVRWRWSRAVWEMIEKRILPGAVSHWMRRKRVIDQLVQQAAKEGFSQLVVLGAGLDSLGLRMHAKQVFKSVISADHPATLRVVRAALSGSGSGAQSTGEVDQLDTMQFMPIDLRQAELTECLEACPRFDSRRETIVVIEGVLMYLMETEVASILGSLARLSVPRIRLVGSWMVAEPGEAIGFRGQADMLQRWLSRVGEPMRWGTTQAGLQSLLREQGWPDSRIINLSVAIEDDAGGTGGLPSEQIFVAERSVTAVN